MSAGDDYPDLAFYATDKGRKILKTDDARRALEEIDRLRAEIASR